MNLKALLIVALVSMTLPWHYASAFAPAPTKNLMVGLGDSMTAASLADTRLISRSRRDQAKQLETYLLYENKETFSWSSGLEVESHFVRLKELMARRGLGKLENLNVAVPGHKAVDLEGQVKTVVDKVRVERFTLKYVTLLMGANDACDAKPPTAATDAAFQANFMKAFAKLAEIRQNEPIRILMSGLPRIPDLGFPAIAERPVRFGLSCRKARDQFLKFCTPLTVWSTPEEYAKRVELVQAKNELLRQIARDAQALHPNLEIQFTDVVWNWELTADLLAIDCFHPSRDGQRLLSSVLWEQQPWFH